MSDDEKKSDPKLVDLPKRDELAAFAENFKRNLPAMLEMTAVVAKLKRQAYLNYIKEGFSEQQALELCKGSVVEI